MTQTEQQFYDLQQIREALSRRTDEFILTLFPQAKREASCYKIGGISGEKGGSMMISTRANNPGYFVDFANPEVKGGPWRLVSLAKGCSLKEGIEWLARFCNVPPIQSFGTISRAKDPEALSRTMLPLSQKSIEFAAARGITEETLRKYGVASDARDGLLFPYYDAFGNLGMTKHWGHKLKPDGKKDTWVSSEPVISIFGKDVCDPETGIQRLIICEGEWDAMACYQAGLPAVSIPMGASNMNWITEDYQFLSHFDEIVLLFDNDEPGKKGAKEAIARLGAERCLNVILPLKDANDMLRANRGAEILKCIEGTTREPLAEIADPESMREATRSYMKGEHLTEGDAFFLPDFDLTFRKHEVTLWFGFSGHGKSQAVQNQVASLMSQGKMCCVASFEQPPELTFSQILLNFTAWPKLAFLDEFDAAYDYQARNVFMYKIRKRADPKHLIQTFIHAHKRYGIEDFVIDNVMTMDIDRGDNTAQAEAADMVRIFAADYPVHVHVVAHPRKPPENTSKAPGMAEIRGASEWGDIPNNVITVWRDMSKAERIAEMEDQNISQTEIDQFWQSTPCGKILVRKQRATGNLPMASFYYHKPTMRFMSTPGTPFAMFSAPAPWRQ
jgi:twinkle protein